ncbi:MAG: 5-oxoprolinase subunit B family protein [Ferrimicrobium sp.]
MNVLPVGLRALLLEFDDQQAVLGFYAEIERRRREGWCPSLIEVIPGARTLLLDGLDRPGDVALEVLNWSLPHLSPLVGRLFEVPTVYDGQDLDEVAHLWGMTHSEAVATHASTHFYVAFCGFAPGFSYLAGLPSELSVPRRPTPRSAVPTGSVALAGDYTGIYPRSSPGGWQLIGRTDLVLWEEGRHPPALLTPGARVRFVEVAP